MSNILSAKDVSALRDELETRAEEAFRKKHGRNPPPRPLEVYDGEVPEEDDLPPPAASHDSGPMSDQELEDQEEMADLRRAVMTGAERAALAATLAALKRELADLEGALESNRDQDAGNPRGEDLDKRDGVYGRIVDIEDILDTYGP